MTRQRTIFWIGLLIYAASFFLVAVETSTPPADTARGYVCAYITMVYPWATAKALPRASPARVFEYVSMLISGLINPMFVAIVILALCERYQRAVAILRIVVPLMIPFCWVVFLYEKYYPREGHFLWIIGMLLVLFSDELPTIHGWRRGSPN